MGRVVVLVTAVALSVASCTGGPSGGADARGTQAPAAAGAADGSVPPASDPGASPQPSGSANSAGSTDDGLDLSPIDEYLLAYQTLSGEAKYEADKANWTRFEDLKAQCMVTEGFEYSPDLYGWTGQHEEVDPDLLNPHPTTREEIAVYGWGLTIPMPLTAEEQFVADHKVELEAFRAAAEQRPYWSYARIPDKVPSWNDSVMR